MACSSTMDSSLPGPGGVSTLTSATTPDNPVLTSTGTSHGTSIVYPIGERDPASREGNVGSSTDHLYATSKPIPTSPSCTTTESPRPRPIVIAPAEVWRGSESGRDEPARTIDHLYSGRDPSRQDRTNPPEAAAAGVRTGWWSGTEEPARVCKQQNLSLRALLSTIPASMSLGTNHPGEETSAMTTTISSSELSTLIMGKKPRTARYSAAATSPGLTGLLNGDSGCSSTSSTPPTSPGTSPGKGYSYYTAHQEQALWKAFNDSVYPSLGRRAELERELKLPAKVIMCFFKSKREGLFKRLRKAGQEDKILKIKEAHKAIAKERRLVKKELKLVLDDVTQSIGEKPKRKKRVSKQSKANQTPANGKDTPADKSKPKKQPKKKQKIKLEGQDSCVDVKVEMPPERQWTPNQQTQSHQQQFTLQPPEANQGYQYGLGGQQLDHWDNRPSIFHSPPPFQLSPGYYGPYHSSTGSSYGFVQCPPNPWLSGVNAVWAPPPQGPSMDNNTWTSLSSDVDPSITHNVDMVNDVQFTQTIGTTDSTCPLATHAHASGFTQNGFNHSAHQDFGRGQFEDRLYYRTSGSSAPSVGQSLPATTAHDNSFYQSTPATQYPIDYSVSPDTANLDPGYDPTPDSSPSHGLYPPTLQTLQPPPPLSPDQHHSPDTTLEHDVHHNHDQSPTQEPSATEANSDSSQKQVPFDLAPLPAPTPPSDLSMGSKPAASPSTTPPQDLTPPRAPYYVYLPHTAPPDHCSYTQPAAYGVRLWMAMGNSFSTQEESTPDPNRTFTYYPNISGIEARDGEDVNTDNEGFSE